MEIAISQIITASDDTDCKKNMYKSYDSAIILHKICFTKLDY